MTNVEFTEVPDAVRRWVEDGPARLGALLGVLHDYDRLRERVVLAEREHERLRGLTHENEELHHRVLSSERLCERLRDEVTRLRAEAAHHEQERVEVAEHLSDIMNQILARSGDGG